MLLGRKFCLFLSKVVDELDLKDGVVLELQEKNGTLVVKVENVEKEKRQVRAIFISRTAFNTCVS